ncbi:zinc finger CCCH domain-containing protein 36-like [Primulina tabacum]|uniref:zinc finger CCCH domain-containing protein 36-like n=1 Tax=Primulina tabacum TaxID=48773 RepID=UPI003F5925EE
MRQTMDKIIESKEASKFPKTKSDLQKYFSASERKIIELIQECYRAADCTFIKIFIVGGRRLEELQKESEKGNVGVAEVDESSTSNNIKAVHSFKFFRIEHIRDLLKPYWKQGNLSRDAYKIIMKKSIDKIIRSIEASKFPKTKSDHQKYLYASNSEIFELIQKRKTIP